MAVYKDRIKLLIQNIMKKILFFSCIAALLSFAGCEETGNGYEGTNYIYLESEGGKTTLLGTDDDPIIVNVKLTKALSEDLTLDFVVEGPQNALTVAGNPVTIKAGEKTASFTIAVSTIEGLSDITNYTVGLDASAQLPDKVALEANFSFSVVAIEIPELTPEQLTIVEAYKTATGIDLSKYLGVVNVSTVITGIDPVTEEDLEPKTVNGVSVITLSETSTAEVPVLKMIANPMGIQDYMYENLKRVTVENTEYWFGEYSLPSYNTLMQEIDWTSESAEVFSMTLDGIKLNGNAISFLGEFTPVVVEIPTEEEDETVEENPEIYVHVPFAYSFSAYDRELAAIADGTLIRDADWAYDATANPAYHLNNTCVTEEYAEEELSTDGYWIEAEATISEDAIVFTFCSYVNENDYDYTRFVATYTPNN